MQLIILQHYQSHKHVKSTYSTIWDRAKVEIPTPLLTKHRLFLYKHQYLLCEHEYLM